MDEELENKQVERLKGIDEVIEDNVLIADSDDTATEVIPILREVTTTVIKSKKVRSQKQIEAFEKAKIKRAENIAVKKEIAEKLKQEKKLARETLKQSIIDNLDASSATAAGAAVSRPPEVKYKPVVREPPKAQAPVINNYYYYNHDGGAKAKQALPKVPVVESSSSEEDYDSEGEEEIYQEPTEPTFKYKFV